VSDHVEVPTLLQKADKLQEALISMATSDHGERESYEPLRRELMGMPAIKHLLPEYVRRYRKLTEFWPYIKGMFSTYAERRHYIRESFTPLFDYLEANQGQPSDAVVSETLERLDAEHVKILWEKALARRTNDPEGAITASRTLVESVCKLILDEHGTAYEDDATLPALYSAVAKLLRLSPSQHSEQVFKQILGGCHSVVEGLGAARNRLSDSHGQGKHPVRPAPRHAELAVNLAGAMSLFLVATWETRIGNGNP
jgi:hypothetical protein